MGQQACDNMPVKHIVQEYSMEAKKYLVIN